MTVEILYLSRDDILELQINMSDIINWVEEAFIEKGHGRVQMPPKPGVYIGNENFIHAMPAYIPKIEAVGIKWISGFPNNYKYGLPYILGLIVINDTKTGAPLAVMEAAWITAMRTGAATAVAAKYLARKDSTSFGIIGCGVEGRSNLKAVYTVFPSLEKVYAYDISREALDRYSNEVSKEYGLDVIRAEHPKEVVTNSDIIVTATPIVKNPNQIVEAAWVCDGIFACPIDFDSYWKPEAMHAMDKFITDDVDQLLYYKSHGYFKDIPDIYADLSEIVIGKKKGRETDDEKIMSMHLGLAIEDMAVARKIYDIAIKKNVGKWLKLM